MGNGGSHVKERFIFFFYFFLTYHRKRLDKNARKLDESSSKSLDTIRYAVSSFRLTMHVQVNSSRPFRSVNEMNGKEGLEGEGGRAAERVASSVRFEQSSMDIKID